MPETKEVDRVLSSMNIYELKDEMIRIGYVREEFWGDGVMWTLGKDTNKMILAELQSSKRWITVSEFGGVVYKANEAEVLRHVLALPVSQDRLNLLDQGYRRGFKEGFDLGSRKLARESGSSDVQAGG